MIYTFRSAQAVAHVSHPDEAVELARQLLRWADTARRSPVFALPPKESATP